MRKKNIFDVLENAENDSMERLIDKCPDISDEQLDRIFRMSEKKFRKQRAEKERTERDNTIKMTENDVVEGVEHSKRPVWLTPLTTAASVLLIAGIAIGSTAMMKRHTKPNGGGGGVTPAVTVSTSTGTGTNIVSTDKNGSTITGTDVTTTTTTVTSVGDGSDQNTADTEFIKPFVGRWRYEMSNINDLDVPESAGYMGTVEITADATYIMTDNSGNVSHGTISNATEEIGGTSIQCLDFSVNESGANDFLTRRAYYDESRPYELHFGNSNIARLVREEYVEPTDTSWQSAYRKEILKHYNKAGIPYNDPMWDLQDIDGDDIPELLISTGTQKDDCVYIYYYENGEAKDLNNTVQTIPYGEYGVTNICKEEHYIGHNYTDNRVTYYEMTKLKDHYPICDIFTYYYDLEQAGETPYGLNARPVSEEEFNQKVDEYNSKNWITVGRQYRLGDFSPLLNK
ncbi:hypothetical protein [Ruminococcus flavefaciens]|uniref:hypothetical protein n=1 Tax=Ruminococcus flavefaciens TaxID=1265 RepID=UPI00048BFD07|nr:hypothetical protein [Ruminococcus flavefaciens]